MAENSGCIPPNCASTTYLSVVVLAAAITLEFVPWDVKINMHSFTIIFLLQDVKVKSSEWGAHLDVVGRL